MLKRYRGIVTDPTCSANRNLNWEKHHLPMSRILIVEPGRKKSLNWSIKKRFNARLTVLLLLRLKSARVESDNFHPFSLVEGPRDDKTQNTHVLNSRASLGTSGNKMADKLRGLQPACRSFDQFYSGVVHNQGEGGRSYYKRRKGCMEVSFQVKKH